MITGATWVVYPENFLAQEAATDLRNRLERQGPSFVALLHQLLRTCPLHPNTPATPSQALLLEKHLQMISQNDNICMGDHLEVATLIDIQSPKGIHRSSVGGQGINRRMTITMVAMGQDQGLGAHLGHLDEAGVLDLPQGVTAGHQKGCLRVPQHLSGVSKAETGATASTVMITMMNIFTIEVAPVGAV